MKKSLLLLLLGCSCIAYALTYDSGGSGVPSPFPGNINLKNTQKIRSLDSAGTTFRNLLFLDTDDRTYLVGRDGGIRLVTGASSNIGIGIDTDQNVTIPIGSLIVTGQLSGKGTATNDAATAGFIGESTSSTTLTAKAFPTSTQYGDLASQSLTAGDWLVTGCVNAVANGATVTVVIIGISQTAGNDSTGLSLGSSSIALTPPIVTNDSGGCVSALRQSLSGTTSVYLKYSSTFTVATPTATGRLSAVRIR